MTSFVYKYNDDITANTIIDGNSNINITKSILTGATIDGVYKDIGVLHDDYLNASILHPITAFGSVSVESLTPVIQNDFVYGINNNKISYETISTGTVTTSNSNLVVSTGTNTGGSAQAQTRDYLKYRPGQGATAMLTALFTTGVANSLQLAGYGDRENGLFVGVNGANGFGITRIRDSSYNWIYKSSFNKDKLDGTGESGINLDITKGNIYRITFQYLGYGAIHFEISHPATGHFFPFHVISYANQNTVTHLKNPSGPITYYVENSGNNTNIVVRSGSCSAFVEGHIQYLGSKYSISNTKTSIGSTNTNIITIQNLEVFNTINNRVPVILTSISIACDGTKPTTIRVTKNTTLGGTPSYTAIESGQSVVTYDVAGTTLTDGTVILTLVLGKSEGRYIPLPTEDGGVSLYPGDFLTLSASTASGTTDVTCSLSWIEDI